jgi:hypothetical protein
VAVVRSFVSPEQVSQRPVQVVEPELDMRRASAQSSPAAGLLRELLRWLMPGSHPIARPPMRSIARELEEVWPSGDR